VDVHLHYPYTPSWRVYRNYFTFKDRFTRGHRVVPQNVRESLLWIGHEGWRLINRPTWTESRFSWCGLYAHAEGIKLVHCRELSFRYFLTNAVPLSQNYSKRGTALSSLFFYFVSAGPRKWRGVGIGTYQLLLYTDDLTCTSPSHVCVCVCVCVCVSVSKTFLHSWYEGWNFNSGNYLFTTDTK